MNQKPQGVVSYAGLDAATLLAGARLMFAGGEEECRLASLMPLFPRELILSMPFVGVAQPGQPVAPGGFSIDPAEYHMRLREQSPHLYAGDNLLRNTDGEGAFHGRGVVTVDEAWTTCFPQYQPYAGERLAIYPLGGGAQCAAVPESLYPKAAGLLRGAETALGITARCHDYAHYVYQRIRAGEMFDAELFETEYLARRGLKPVSFSQQDLGRLMQDLSMLRSVQEGGSGDALYTEHAKRAEHLRQYVPGLYACDVFEEIPQTRRTARLLQPMWEEGFVSDWWICCQDAAAYIDKDSRTLDMAALCQGYQLAPVYDPLTRGGRYPARVRVVTVRDKELRLRAADTLNNPAYGSGMTPLGTISRLIYLPDSRELLRQGKLTCEEEPYLCENTAVPPAHWRRMTAAALLQEEKGKLVDALYRRESVMSGVSEISPEYDRLRAMMNRPVEALESGMQGREKTHLSGYDADLDYLRRMGQEREWKPMPNKRKPFRFAPDALRQASIESGFAMRTACLRFAWDDLALPVDAGAAEDTSAALRSADVRSAVSPAGVLSADALSDDPRTADIPADAPAQRTDAEPQPLWLNAADPECLSEEARALSDGGAAGKAASSAAGAAVSVADAADGAAGGPAAVEGTAADAAGETDAKPKGKKKGGKKTSKKQKKPKGNAPFTEEELLRRQVPMKLPDPLPGEVGMQTGSATDSAANGTAANSSTAIPAVVDGGADPAATNVTGSSAASAAGTPTGAAPANGSPAPAAHSANVTTAAADPVAAAPAGGAAGSSAAGTTAAADLAAAGEPGAAPAAPVTGIAGAAPIAGAAATPAASINGDPAHEPDASLQQLKNGQLSFRFDELL